MQRRQTASITCSDDGTRHSRIRLLALKVDIHFSSRRAITAHDIYRQGRHSICAAIIDSKLYNAATRYSLPFHFLGRWLLLRPAARTFFSLLLSDEIIAFRLLSHFLGIDAQFQL